MATDLDKQLVGSTSIAPTPDRTIRLASTSGLLLRIATAMIARHGVYTYTDAGTGEKVRVLP